jgi:hypothetical protein
LAIISSNIDPRFHYLNKLAHVKSLFYYAIMNALGQDNTFPRHSEGQDKYLRELSITPVGYFTGAIKNHSRAVSRNYFAWQKWGISEEQEWYSQG